MILTYHEGACIRASVGDTALVFGPASKRSKLFKPVNFGADVAFISCDHPDMNGGSEAARGDKRAFIIAGPGEYEVSGISVAAFPSHTSWDGQERINTIYSLVIDGMSILYLGALEGSMPAEVLEMDSPDILIAPVGGRGTLSPAEAQKLAVKLEPKIVIPILYEASSLRQFQKEAGADDVKPMDKLTIKSRDLAGKEGEIVILAP